MDTRLLIAVILSLAAIFAYQELVLKRLYPPSEQPQSQQQQARPSPRAGTESLPLPGLPAVATGAAVGKIETHGPARTRTIDIKTDAFSAEFTTLGARLSSLKLRKFRETSNPDSPPLELIKPVAGGQLPLGVVIKTASGRLDDRDANYQTDAPSHIVLHDGERATVNFSATGPQGLKLAKRIQFDGQGYLFNLDATVAGAPGQIEAGGLEMSQPLTPHKGYYDVPEIQALVNGKTAVDTEKALRKGVEPLRGKITYAGFGDRYFLTVFLPQTDGPGTLAMDFDGLEATATMLFAPPAAGVAHLVTQVYMGPKDLTTLEAINPDLRKSIDFGWTGILALAFLRALKLFHRITPNYGVDIILLTVAIRVVFLPMSIKGQRSMMRMQRLQPQVEKLREKFQDDRERLNREMVDLYKRNHVNPLGGCAPMLLQLPIFVGLYQALLNAVELRHAPFVGWIKDLSAPECLPIPGFPKLSFLPCTGLPVLVLLMGASTYLQQMMAPQSPDPSQQKMMMLMPLVFTIMFLNFPAGLTLYYFSSNVLGIAQQYILNREFKQLSPANP